MELDDTRIYLFSLLCGERTRADRVKGQTYIYRESYIFFVTNVKVIARIFWLGCEEGAPTHLVIYTC